MSKFVLIFIVMSLVGCGVKGPPEPPLATEGLLKKEKEKEKDKEADSKKKKTAVQ